MKVDKPVEGIIDLALWIWLFPVMLTLYVFMIGKEVKS